LFIRGGMKKLSSILRIVCLVILVSPLALAWLPSSVFAGLVPSAIVESGYFSSLFLSFRELSITLAATMVFCDVHQRSARLCQRAFDESRQRVRQCTETR
jgi:hypothetical protein